MIFPAAFGSDDIYVVGSTAKDEIFHNEAFIYIPIKILITVERALSSEIGFIFEKHVSIFKSTEDRDYLILLMFLIYEHQRGENSLWFPYF